VNHRGAPTFTYPAAVEDVERAVRFVRFNAESFGINKDRIGGWGSSSGGHLIALMAVMDGKGIPHDEDPVNRQSAKIQCVAAVAPTTDFLHPQYESGNMHLFMGIKPDSMHSGILRLASPITHVTGDDPPFLMIHGDRDPVVPYDLSVRMLQTLMAVRVPAKLIRIPGGGHDAFFRGIDNPNYRVEMVRWFDRYLKR
jgi:acetyl esterase/lipase